MKRHLKALCLLVCLFMFIITGCSSQSSKDTKTETEKKTEKETEVVTEAETEGVTEAPVESASTKTSSATKSSSTSSFSNAYGTATTKCAHAGCNNNIASSGDTNCCTTHSKRCLECNKYIDEDAMYCMSCLSKAADKASSKKSSGSSSYSSGKSSYSSGSSSSSSGTTGAGGYDMPNENDKSFSDYVKRVAPDLYSEMEATYNDALN